MSSTQPAPVKKTLFTEGFLQDPYPTYQHFLEEGHIHYVDCGAGAWAVFHYADCASLLKDSGTQKHRVKNLFPVVSWRQTAVGQSAHFCGESKHLIEIGLERVSAQG